MVQQLIVLLQSFQSKMTLVIYIYVTHDVKSGFVTHKKETIMVQYLNTKNHSACMLIDIR